MALDGAAIDAYFVSKQIPHEIFLARNISALRSPVTPEWKLHTSSAIQDSLICDVSSFYCIARLTCECGINMAKKSTLELSKHNQPQDAWILIEKTIWDVTDFADKHPGGAEIIYQYIGHGQYNSAVLDKT